jgi:predicted transcriptional regulator
LAAEEPSAGSILDLLETEGPLTTTELSDKLGVERSRVYRECRRLEDAGQLISALQRIYLSFSPLTDEMITLDNHKRLRKLAADIRSIIERYDLPRQRAELRSALKDHFEKLYRRPDLKPFINTIKRFASKLLRQIENETEKPDLYELLSTGFPAGRRFWALPQHRLALKARVRA